jgi:mRNA degradation ribonuclease J1/J2
MNAMDELSRIEEEERIYYDFKSREEKYKQLTKILSKLHNKSSYSNKDTELYLKDKISEMSILRTNLLSIDDKL